jgi:RNA polymerase subunit RPABC4/transcription elongation factor Spt4
MSAKMSERPGGFCTECGHEVNSFEGLNGCPKCGTKGLPCAWRDQVTVTVNWHELRVLGIWAENYGRSIEKQNVIFAIARRLQVQHPGRAPLTMAGELMELRKHYNATTSDGDLNADVQRLESEEDPT